MATVIALPPGLSGDLALFHTTDPLLSNSPVLVFHGAASTIGATSSRIQIHVLTPAGLASYPRLAVSPNSPFYSAVVNLPREEQGDEVCRGIAFALKKYFEELEENVKSEWCIQAKAPSATSLFGDHHIAILATRMTKIENVDEVVANIAQAFGEERLLRSIVDVVLPPGSIKGLKERPDSPDSDELMEHEVLKEQFGRYADIVSAFGEATFLPSSKMKRAPSKASSIGRSASFLRNQKEKARKEINELLQTEQSFVGRLRELQEISVSVRATASGSDLNCLDEVFPTTLENIVQVNANFLEELQELVGATANEALKDIESSQVEETTTLRQSEVCNNDVQAIGRIAKCLCQWFPQFANNYQAYLLGHAQASQVLRSLLRSESPLATRLHEIGEQRLNSLLIEPIQRLPRYNLYIDGITKQLPVKHFALRPLMKARDMITEICAEGIETGAMLQRLQRRTTDWPTDLTLRGRLVTVVDFTEMQFPCKPEDRQPSDSILLVLTDGLLMVKKLQESSVSSRTLLAELEDSQVPGVAYARTDLNSAQDLQYLRHVRFQDVQLTESHGGRALTAYAFSCADDNITPGLDRQLISKQVLRLEGGYDGKASRLIDEICKAQVEGNFNEAERESFRWQFRSTEPVLEGVTLYSAIFDNGDPTHIGAREGNADVQILVDIDRHGERPRAGQNGVHTVIALSLMRDSLWRMTVDTIYGTFNHEHLGSAEVVPSIRRKLVSICTSRFAVAHREVTAYLLAYATQIICSFDLKAEDSRNLHERPQPVQRDRARSKSPRKMITNFLSSVAPGSEPPNLFKKDAPPLHAPSQIPRVASAGQSKPPSRESRPPSRDLPTPKTVSSFSETEISVPSVMRLEETLMAYVLALKARKGNVVGRNLKLRANADELLVNELYNSLLEDANTMALAAQASVDVLFCAFEKFVNNIWREHFGQVIPNTVMQGIQQKAEALFPADFDTYVRSALTRLAPQNQRAFKAIMNLLTDLLDGTGNDGDRGILTAAFAELLVTDGNPHDYIAVIDRFVDDSETYFGEPLGEVQQQNENDTSIGHKRARSVNTASLSSNHSSLRRKFGFSTLSRENSKSEMESRVASVWRTLSKSTRGDTSPGDSISRGSHGRHMSGDSHAQRPLSRPTSQDGPKTTSFTEQPPTSNAGLSTIGEHPTFIPTGPPRKKRRSSLSDLHALDAVNKRDLWSPPSSRYPPLPAKAVDENKSLPDSPVPSTPSSKGGSARLETPSRMPRPQLPASFRSEISLDATPSGAATVAHSIKSSGGKVDEVTITARPLSRLHTKPSSPTKHSSPSLQRFGLAERPNAGNIVKRTSPRISKAKLEPTSTVPANNLSPSPKKLRMQSPQKLRERLQAEQYSLAEANSSLQAELHDIGQQLTASPSRIELVRTGHTASSNRNSTVIPAGTLDLAQRVLRLEGQLPQHAADSDARIVSIQTDLSSSLSVSEMKCKKLDELYREANSENEALYTRFNGELGRILKAVKGGEGVDELKRKLQECQQEAATLRREASRLKRENAGLRAQLRE